jgi:hypothetical protein
MTDLSRLKRLGAPPSPDEASTNLEAPETAPLGPGQDHEGRSTATAGRRRDARSLRRTHRTLAFATRVSPEFDNRLRDIAERDGLKLVELLERALDAYEAQHKT